MTKVTNSSNSMVPFLLVSNALKSAEIYLRSQEMPNFVSIFHNSSIVRSPLLLASASLNTLLRIYSSEFPFEDKVYNRCLRRESKCWTACLLTSESASSFTHQTLSNMRVKYRSSGIESDMSE